MLSGDSNPEPQYQNDPLTTVHNCLSICKISTVHRIISFWLRKKRNDTVWYWNFAEARKFPSCEFFFFENFHLSKIFEKFKKTWNFRPRYQFSLSLGVYQATEINKYRDRKFRSWKKIFSQVLSKMFNIRNSYNTNFPHWGCIKGC